MDAPNMRRIVILGKTGAGKSSLGNTLFGKEEFTVCYDSVSAENPCQAKTQSLNGIETTLIDTPGFFDTNKPEEEWKAEIVKCITECSPGPHAFLIVLKVEKFTDQENDVINKITQYFSEEVFRFSAVVFTHGDDLQDGQKIKDFVRPNSFLNNIVKKCGGRYHVIDNKRWKNLLGDIYRSNNYQVKEILKSVEEIVKANNGNCYTNEFLQTVEEMTQQKEKSIALSSENMSSEENRQEAKSRVCDILNKAAGITTGVLLGALFGAAAMVKEAVQSIHVVEPIIYETTANATPAATIAQKAIVGAVTGPTAVKAAAVLGTAAVGIGAATGAGVGAFKGYYAAKDAETPWDAMKKTVQALQSSGEDKFKK